MNYINLSDNQANSSTDNIGSIGTEHNPLNDNFNMIFKKMTQTGGNGNISYDDLMIEAAKDGEFSVVFYLIDKKKIQNIGATDKDGNNILHYLVYNYSKMNENDSKKFLEKIVSQPSVNNIINTQNYVDKNTPLHIAVALNLDDVAETLINHGANKTIMNKNGEYVENDSETEKHSANYNRELNSKYEKNKPNLSNNTDTDIFIQKRKEEKPESILDNIVKLFVGDKGTLDTSDASLRMTATDIKPKVIGTTQYNGEPQVPSGVSVTSHNDTSDIINDIIGSKVSGSTDTDNLVNDIMKNKIQSGGKRDKKHTNVATNYYEDSNRLRRQIGYGDAENNNKKSKQNVKRSAKMDISEMNSDNSSEEKNELSRLVQNQATAIHARTVKKIMELLNVNEEDAQIYKAALYESVRNDSPELNNYDRAVEMEKRANSATLKTINLEQWRKKINENKEKRKVEPKRQARYHDSADMSNTSVISVTSSDNSDSSY